MSNMVGIASDGIWGGQGGALAGAGNATNTTFAAIRDQLVTVIKALTPNRHAGKGFIFAPRKPIGYAKGTDFREWAEANDGACFRHYDIRSRGWARVAAQDPGTQRRAAVLELIIAYPQHYRLYGDDNSADLDDIIEQDISQLAANIGIRAAANWLSASTPIDEGEVEIEDGEGVTFGVLPVGFEYFYATS